MYIKSKMTSYGLVEIRQESGDYVLYVNGTVEAHSSSLDFIMREFDKW